VQEPFTPDEFDLQLVQALQVSPRASWTLLSRVLDADPVTVSRRWERLRGAGLARVTAFTPVQTDSYAMAQLQLACDLGKAADVAATLANDADVFTVQHSTGRYNVVINLKAARLDDLSAFVMNRVGSIPGVNSAVTHIQTTAYLDASSWELGALTASQRDRLMRAREGASDVRVARESAADGSIYRTLVHDGRISLSKLASEIGLSISTTGRRLQHLLVNRRIVLRCDVARHLFGWSVCVDLHGTAPGDPRSYASTLRREIPEIRLFSGIAAARNLRVVLWLRRIEDLGEVETRLQRWLPGFVIHERAVLLETVKQAGHILDRYGRTTRIVPTTF
jgi:DNA-binding Lrp family transcriptional regulator